VEKSFWSCLAPSYESLRLRCGHGHSREFGVAT